MNARQVLALVLALFVGSAAAQSGLPVNPTCPNANLFGGGIVTEVCWNCMLPIRIAGVPFVGPNVPIGAASPECVCPGRLFGIPTPGPSMGMWQPQHIMEIVRQPFCSPVLGTSLAGSSGVGTGLTALSQWGGYSDNEPQQQSYYQMHYYLFPLAVILDQMTDAVCASHAGSDMDLLYMTEIDPTWGNDELSLFTTPEAVLFADPIAIAACAEDAAQATTFQPDPLLYWCAGSWGTIYPFTGHSTQSGDPPRDSSLVATRGLGLLHRRLLAEKTMGDDAVCHAIPYPLLVKNQYKMQTMFPIPELGTDHWIGASPFAWGEWRNIPGVGEDFVYLLFNWVDCCLNY